MARAVAAASSQQISGTYSDQKNQSKLTLAGWVYRETSSAITAFGFLDSSTDNFGILWNNEPAPYLFCSAGSLVYANRNNPVTDSTTGWVHVALVFDGTLSGNSNRLKYFRNGEQLSLAYAANVPSATSNSSNINTFRIGAGSPFGGSLTYYNPSNYAEIAMWQEALTAQDVTSLYKGFSPKAIVPDKIKMYIPLIRDLQDIKSGITLTDSSTSVVNHPRIYGL